MDLRSFPVSARWANALLIPAALVAFAPGLHAQASEDEAQTDAYTGENTDRFASLRVLEGEGTIRKGDVEEVLSRGIPVTEGDVVESHGRGVLQLADGTRVAFGPETRFEVASLFKENDPDHQVLLRLDQGQLRVAMGRESEARLRLDTPSGTALLSDGASAGFEVELDRTVRVKVHSGRVLFSNERDKADILAGEQLTVYSDQDRLDRVRDFNTYGGNSFDSWCDRALVVRRGPSWERVPPEIRYYSDDLDEHGEWIYVDELNSWCWRPKGVSPEWRPYWRGRWGAYPGGMTWISEEPWGYVTYHHGRWGWGAGFGWYWIPGANYAPAWVDWQTSDTYIGWAPMGFHDRPVSWGYGSWGGGFCWNIVEINFIHDPHLHSHTHDQPGIIHGFGNGPTGNRPLSPPWHQGPLVVRPSEFHHPAEMQQLLREPHAAQERLHAYEQQTGRTLFRQPHTPAPQPVVTDSGHRNPSPNPPVIHYGTIQPPPGSSAPQHPIAPPLFSPHPNWKAPQESPAQPHRIPKGPVTAPAPPPPPPTGPLPVHKAPEPPPVQPHGTPKAPVTEPVPLPPPVTSPHPNRKAPQELPAQPHGNPKGPATEPAPPTSSPAEPVPWWLKKKKRPLSHP